MCKEMHSESIDQLVTALSKAQGSVLKAKEDKKNPFYKSSYADLESVWNSCRDALSENGIAVIQTIDEGQNKMLLVTTLGHTSGQWIKSFAPIPNVKQDAQSIGSAITYMRRYSLAAIVGVSTSDDDGNAATKSYKEEKQKKSDKIKSLTELLKNDLELKKRIDEYILKEGLEQIEDLPEQVINVTIKSAMKRAKERIINIQQPKAAEA